MGHVAMQAPIHRKIVEATLVGHRGYDVQVLLVALACVVVCSDATRRGGWMVQVLASRMTDILVHATLGESMPLCWLQPDGATSATVANMIWGDFLSNLRSFANGGILLQCQFTGSNAIAQHRCLVVTSGYTGAWFYPSSSPVSGLPAARASPG